MAWYFESVIEDLSVPKDEDTFDCFPSPDSWSSWSIIGNFNSSKKLNVFGVEELLLSENTFSREVEQWCTPNVSQCSRQSSPREHSDFGPNDLSIIDEADDIFLHSIFEGDANAKEEADWSAKFAHPSSKDDIMSVVDPSGETNCVEDCTHDVENHSPFPPAKELELEKCVLEEHPDDVCEDMIDEDISMEDSALVELQRLTLQLAKETRICIRDSLYRLAENSIHHSKCSPNGKEDLEKLQDSEARKLETNAVDRTVVTLLFNVLKRYNLVAASTSGLTAEMPQGECKSYSRFYQPLPVGDVEVPKGATTMRSYSLLNKTNMA